MAKSALEVVQNFQQALGSGTDAWQNWIQDDIQFKGPVDQVTGKDAFIELNQKFMPMVRGYTPVSAFEQGDKVSLEGVFTVATPKDNTIDLAMAEIYEIAENKIQNIRVYYDAEEFRKEFAQ